MSQLIDQHWEKDESPETVVTVTCQQCGAALETNAFAVDAFMSEHARQHEEADRGAATILAQQADH